MAEKSEDDGAIGYRKPPAETQFKSGQSGNPRGRPKGARNEATILSEIANEKHSITRNGEVQQVKTIDLLFVRLRELALKGDEAALEALNDWTSKLEAEARTEWTFGLVVNERYYGVWDSPLKVETVEEPD